MQQTQQNQTPELPDEALNQVLNGTIVEARYVQNLDMSRVTIAVEYSGKSYRVRKNMWASRGGSITKHDRCMVAMCGAQGLDYDTFARTVPERLDLANKSYFLTVAVHRTESGKLWPEIISYTVNETGKERTREQIIEDASARLSMQVSEMQTNLCMLADTQQKAESECRRLRKAYEELSMEYRMVVVERDRLRQQLGMPPVASMLPENILDISGNLPRKPRKGRDDELVQDDEILTAFMEGKI